MYLPLAPRPFISWCLSLFHIFSVPDPRASECLWKTYRRPFPVPCPWLGAVLSPTQSIRAIEQLCPTAALWIQELSGGGPLPPTVLGASQAKEIQHRSSRLNCKCKHNTAIAMYTWITIQMWFLLPCSLSELSVPRHWKGLHGLITVRPLCSLQSSLCCWLVFYTVYWAETLKSFLHVDLSGLESNAFKWLILEDHLKNCLTSFNWCICVFADKSTFWSSCWEKFSFLYKAVIPFLSFFEASWAHHACLFYPSLPILLGFADHLQMNRLIPWHLC